MNALVLFPHQLWFQLPEISPKFTQIFLVEEFLFFKQFNFHKLKIAYHRATMCEYADALRQQGYFVNYVQTFEDKSDIRVLIPWVKKHGFDQLIMFEPEDFLLKKRVLQYAKPEGISLIWFDNQLFINTIDDLIAYQSKSKRLFQTDFYVYQRKLRNILLVNGSEPLGGKWSFDAENRKKYPAKKIPPKISPMRMNKYHEEAKAYVEAYFPCNLGSLTGKVLYPTNPKDANIWFTEFLENRFSEFGEFEDAMVDGESFLHHSVLTPMLNVGILKPMDVIEKAIDYAFRHDIEVCSLEGFVRQILGWREFVRYVYHFHSVRQRTTNFWGFERKIPNSFYSGTTGIRPIDDCILKLHDSAYSHHIERLMVLSNFMLLCEFDPDEVYRWFMEMYIDSYDWVMVPNVYGMAQFSDGGLMVSKPYISGSNYLFKMSNYKKGESWADVWDALFWRFIAVNRSFFKKNPRLSMLVNTFEKWPEEKKNLYVQRAEVYLNDLGEEKI